MRIASDGEAMGSQADPQASSRCPLTQASKRARGIRYIPKHEKEDLSWGGAFYALDGKSQTCAGKEADIPF